MTIHHRIPHAAAVVVAVGCFIAATVAANLATAHYGLISVGFGLSATAGTYTAGLVLTVRDWVHDLTGTRLVYACIAAGAVVSAATAGPQLAAASWVAFTIAELADLYVYTPLRQRGWARAVLASNTVGALVDTTVFLTVAGFPITAAVLAGQLTAKTTATLAVITPVVIIRALLRHRLRPQRA